MAQVKQSPHEASRQHEEQVRASGVCGCFYCLRQFAPSAIVEWVEEARGGRTACCPFCGIDAVMGSTSGFPATTAFLRQMRQHWFR